MPIYSIKIMTDSNMLGGVRSMRQYRRVVFCFAVIALFFAIVLPGGAAHLPKIPKTAFEIHTHGRLFFALENLSFMLEYVGRFEEADMEFRYQSFALGGYYRLHPNIKLGAFYKLQLNARHDDDWVKLPEGGWEWIDASERFEHLGMVDLTPRIALDFLPGKNWVASLKSRYEYNFTQSLHTLLVRPGLSFFWVLDRQPFLNFALQYALYLSLNFGEVPWYRHGPYFNVLFHLSENILLDVGVSRQWLYWTESEDFLEGHPNENYTRNIYEPWIVDLGFILKF